MLRFFQFFGSFIPVVLLTAGFALPSRADICDDIIFKGCLLDSLEHINSLAVNINDDTSNDFIIQLNTKLLLYLFIGNPDSGIELLNKIDDTPFRDFVSTAVVRALEIDGHVTKAGDVLSRISNPSDRAAARAYRALVHANYSMAIKPALIALKHGEVGPLIGVLELTPPARSSLPCDDEPSVSKRCLAQIIRHYVAEEGDQSVVAQGRAIAFAIEGKTYSALKIIRSFPDKEAKAAIALGTQRAYAAMGEPYFSEKLMKYTGHVDATYLLDKALAANNLPEAYNAMKMAIHDGSLHAFLDVYQDAPNYPPSLLPD